MFFVRSTKKNVLVIVKSYTILLISNFCCYGQSFIIRSACKSNSCDFLFFSSNFVGSCNFYDYNFCSWHTYSEVDSGWSIYFDYFGNSKFFVFLDILDSCSLPLSHSLLNRRLHPEVKFCFFNKVIY